MSGDRPPAAPEADDLCLFARTSYGARLRLPPGRAAPMVRASMFDPTATRVPAQRAP